MRVTSIASACVVIEHRGIKVLCDPWLVDGAYYGSWFHNPPLSVEPEDFHDCPYIYLSHIHQDHADLATLKRLNKRSTVLLAPYADTFLHRMVAGRGFPVKRLAHGVPCTLGKDFQVTLYGADDCNPQACGAWIGCPIPHALPGLSYQIDSLAVFQGGGQTVVNVNDCPYPLTRTILERLAPVDLCLTAYSGAGPWPQCFPQLDEATREQAAANKRDLFLRYAHQTAETLRARHWIPFAGQYTLGGKLQPLNRFRGVPTLDDIPPHPGMVRLSRMGVWDCEREEGTAFIPRDGERAADYESLLRDVPLAYERQPHRDGAALFEDARARWAERCADRHLTVDWTITVNGRLLCEGAKGEIAVTLDDRLLYWLLRRKAHWNAAEIGSHLTFERSPNVYERTPYYALSYFHM